MKLDQEVNLNINANIFCGRYKYKIVNEQNGSAWCV